MTQSTRCYYLTKELVIEVGLSLKQAKEKAMKYKGNGKIQIKKDPYTLVISK